MKIHAILVGTNGHRIEEHELLVPSHRLTESEIHKARDFLRKRAKELGRKPVAGYTFERGYVRVWAEEQHVGV